MGLVDHHSSETLGLQVDRLLFCTVTLNVSYCDCGLSYIAWHHHVCMSSDFDGYINVEVSLKFHLEKINEYVFSKRPEHPSCTFIPDDG